MSKKLAGKVAVVTGASKGIGASVALHLAKEGASVVVNYSTSKEGAERVVSEITQNGGKALAVQADMSNPNDIPKLFLEASKAFGKIDILVNNAGIYEFAPLEEITLEHCRKTLDLNVIGLILATKEAVKYFGKSGSIVNISSIASTSTPSHTTLYSASKAAVDAIAKVLAKELGPRNIRINNVNPGIIATEGTQTKGILESDFRKNIEAQTPLGRIGSTADVAPAVAFLASDEASWITGETLYITGGLR